MGLTQVLVALGAVTLLAATWGWPSPENGFCWLAEPKASDQAEAEEEGPENQR